VPDGKTARGQLKVYLGAILLAEIDLAIRVDSAHREPVVAGPPHSETMRPYRKIFASYSHKDADIVRQYEALVESFGDRYLRDVRDLRAGETWDPRLLAMIEEADVFQLFWSTNSMKSPFVRKEWEHALELGRSNFIRPTYWENPLPASEVEGLPPETLRRLHFHQVDADLLEPRWKRRPRRSRKLLDAVSASILFITGIGLFLSTSWDASNPDRPPLLNRGARPPEDEHRLRLQEHLRQDLERLGRDPQEVPPSQRDLVELLRLDLGLLEFEQLRYPVLKEMDSEAMQEHRALLERMYRTFMLIDDPTLLLKDSWRDFMELRSRNLER
jgi:hypothetical protein